jgi:hypothetical protein
MEEEHIFILKGSATLHLGNNSYVLKEGDYCCFPAGARAITLSTIPTRSAPSSRWREQAGRGLLLSQVWEGQDQGDRRRSEDADS